MVAEVIRLKEKVTPKSLLFCLPIAIKHSAFPPTEVSASEVPAILKKFVSKEALSDVIPSDSKLEVRRKTSNRIGILHKVSKTIFSSDYQNDLVQEQP